MSQPEPPPASPSRAEHEEIQKLIRWLQQDPLAAKRILAYAQALWPSTEFVRRDGDKVASEALAHPLVSDAILRMLRTNPPLAAHAGAAVGPSQKDIKRLFGAMRSIRSSVAGQEADEKGQSHEIQLKHANVTKKRKEIRDLIAGNSDPLGDEVLSATLDLAEALSDLGIALQAQHHFTRHFRTAVSAVRQHDGATEVFTEALTFYNHLLQAGHPGVTDASLVTTLRMLIVVLRAQDRNCEAEPHFIQLTRVLTKLYGAHHPSLAKAIYDHAAVLRALGMFPQAESRCLEALAIQEVTLNQNHPDASPRDLRATLDQLGILYRYQGKNPANLDKHWQRLNPKAPVKPRPRTAADREMSARIAASVNAGWVDVVDHLLPSKQWEAELKSGGQPSAPREPVAAGNPEESLIIEETRSRFLALFDSHPTARLYAEGKLNNLTKKQIQSEYGLSNDEHEAARKKYDREIGKLGKDGQLP